MIVSKTKNVVEVIWEDASFPKECNFCFDLFDNRESDTQTNRELTFSDEELLDKNNLNSTIDGYESNCIIVSAF